MRNKASIEIPEHWQAVFYRYCRPATLVWPLLAAMAFIAWNRGLALLYALCALVLAALLLSLFTKWRLRQIRTQVNPIAPVHVGQPQTVSLELQADKPIYGCQLVIRDIHATSSLNDASGHNQKISDQQINDLRFQALVITSQPSKLTCSFTPDRRGIWQLNQLLAESAYPFGLIRWQQKVAIEPITHIVYPALVPIKSLPRAWLSGSEQHAHFTARHKGAGELLLGLRDYQTGDAFRHIDWRASARSGDVKVREFEQLEHPHLCLMINNHESLNIGEAPANALEHSLILAASLARFALQAGLGLSVYLPDGQYMTISRHHQLQYFFEALAGITPSTNTTESFTPKAGCICVSVQTDKHLMSITPTPAKHWRIIFDSESYLKPLSRKKVDKPVMSGNEVTIPVGAHSSLTEVFNG